MAAEWSTAISLMTKRIVMNTCSGGMGQATNFKCKSPAWYSCYLS